MFLQCTNISFELKYFCPIELVLLCKSINSIYKLIYWFTMSLHTLYDCISHYRPSVVSLSRWQQVSHNAHQLIKRLTTATELSALTDKSQQIFVVEFHGFFTTLTSWLISDWRRWQDVNKRVSNLNSNTICCDEGAIYFSCLQTFQANCQGNLTQILKT